MGKGEEPLHVIFNVNMMVNVFCWQAAVTIYNLSQETVLMIAPDALSGRTPMEMGAALTLSAGYDSGFDAEANLIFSGQVLQPVWTRESVVDYTLKLRLITGLLEDTLNLCSITQAKQTSALDTIKAICKKSEREIPIQNGGIDEAAQAKLSATVYPRAQSFHGRPFDQLKPILRQHNLFSWLGPQGLNIRSFAKDDSAPEVTYGPPNKPGAYTGGGLTTQGLVKMTIIGTPEQTQCGVVFRVLLDSQVYIGQTVQIAPGTNVKPFEFVYPENYRPTRNDAGVYVVIGIRHFGDNRGQGDDWFTEITGVTKGFFPEFLGAKSDTASSHDQSRGSYGVSGSW
ncbi:MAG TPA: hypothetical protein VJ801_15020 [Polyangia bacterium]|nr:hypothetical protein [Polyangia bacterium]